MRWAFGYWTDHHIDAERKLNLRAAIDKAAGDPEKVKDTRGLLAPLLRDTLVSLQLRALRAARRADPVHQSAVRAQPRFLRHAGHRPHLARHRSLRHRLALERRRPPGRLALRPALRAGRSRAEFPDSHADAGADLGRPGSADDPEREDSALVERDARADALGGTAHALRPRAAGRSGPRSRPPHARCSPSLGSLAAPARTRQVARLLEQGAVREAAGPCDALGDVPAWPGKSAPGEARRVRASWPR